MPSTTKVVSILRNGAPSQAREGEEAKLADKGLVPILRLEIIDSEGPSKILVYQRDPSLNDVIAVTHESAICKAVYEGNILYFQNETPVQVRACGQSLFPKKYIDYLERVIETRKAIEIIEQETPEVMSGLQFFLDAPSPASEPLVQ